MEMYCGKEQAFDLAIEKQVNFSWLKEVIYTENHLSIREQKEMYNKIVGKCEKLTLAQFVFLKSFIIEGK